MAKMKYQRHNGPVAHKTVPKTIRNYMESIARPVKQKRYTTCKRSDLPQTIIDFNAQGYILKKQRSGHGIVDLTFEEK